ncbi:hypothetical protein ACP70R_015171 [Stipagrostis hirtigluma subsp. patula]
MAAAALMDELVEEVLLRVPPDDPARLLRAALVCKRWGRLVSGRGFRRRYRDLHRAPPVLGFLSNIPGVNLPCVARFVPTSSFRPPRPDHTSWRALHSAHGRVLLFNAPWGRDPKENHLRVWVPATDERRELPTLSWQAYPEASAWNAAVLCAAGADGGCDHLDCHSSSFLVVFVGTCWDKMVACVYSSEADAWSEPTAMQERHDYLSMGTNAIVGNAIYFKYRGSTKVLKFDWTTNKMSVIHLPAEVSQRRIVLMAMEDGRLGFATVHKSRLYLWSLEVGPNGVARWAQCRNIELDTLLPISALSTQPRLAACSDGPGVILMGTNDVFLAVHLKSGKIKKLGEGHGYYDSDVPFMSFCTPAIGAACTDEGSQAGSSNSGTNLVAGPMSST